MQSSHPTLPLNQILIGDAHHHLAQLPTAAVDTIITSPPYFGLRDYGHPDQLGLEENVEAWVKNLTEVCHELARVLKPTGSLWLNVGDGYSAHQREGAAVKSLLLGPARLAIALASDGWTLRNQVVWHKPNAIPQSTCDRLSNRHELVLFLTRNPRYYFDLDAIREPAVSAAGGTSRVREAHYLPKSAVPYLGRAPRVNLNRGLRRLDVEGRKSHPLGRNPGDVWSIGTAGFRGAHFATFPPALVRRALLATCPIRVCTGCGQPWRKSMQVVDGRELATGPMQPDCGCGQPSRPGVVLDPFLGSGTTALVAEQHGRDWVGVELNPEYAAMAEERIERARAKHDARSDLGESPAVTSPDRPPPVFSAA
jgi:DNA modification methylase